MHIFKLFGNQGFPKRFRNKLNNTHIIQNKNNRADDSLCPPLYDQGHLPSPHLFFPEQGNISYDWGLLSNMKGSSYFSWGVVERDYKEPL
jgi:hypothetical protein